MSLSQAYDLLGGSPLGRALAHYVQNGMAPNFLRRLTLRLCYWYQSINGYQTTTLDVRNYRRTRTALEELRYAYILWQRHRCICRCGCEVNNAGLGTFPFVVNRMRDGGWFGEDSEDDRATAGRDGRILEDDRRDGLGSSLTDNPDTMRRGRVQSRAFRWRNFLSSLSTDESAGSPPRERSPSENHPSLTPVSNSGDRLITRRREEVINSRSRSSPPNPSTEQRNSLVITLAGSARSRGRSADRASNDWGNCRNISTASLMNRIMGRSVAEWSNLRRRARPSSNISSRTSRRSRRSSMNGRGMSDPPVLARAQRREGDSSASSGIGTRTRDESVERLVGWLSMLSEAERSSFSARVDDLYNEGLSMLSEAERSSFSARMDDIYNEELAGSANSWGELVDRWRRLSSLVDQLPDGA